MKILGLSFWNELGKGFVTVFGRFPLAVLSAIVCTVAASILLDVHPSTNAEAYSRLIKLAYASGLGISTFTLTGLIAENFGGKFSDWGIFVSLAGLLIITVFGLLITIDDQGRLPQAGYRLSQVDTLFLQIYTASVGNSPAVGTSAKDWGLWIYRYPLSRIGIGLLVIGN